MVTLRLNFHSIINVLEERIVPAHFFLNSEEGVPCFLGISAIDFKTVFKDYENVKCTQAFTSEPQVQLYITIRD